MRFTLNRRDPSDTGPFTSRHVALLPATPDRVFEVLADEAPWPEWLPNLQRSRWLTSEPHGVGSLRRVDLAGGFRGLEHVVGWEPGVRMTFFLSRANIPLLSHLSEDIQLTPEGRHTRVTWQVHYQPRRALRPLRAALAPALDRTLSTGLRNLAAWFIGSGR